MDEFKGDFSEYLKILNRLYNLAHGDWEDSEGYKLNQYLLFIFNTVLLPLVLMNFVIALIVKTHDNFHHLKYFTDYREMIVLLQTMNSFTRGIFSSETGIMS